MLRGELHNRGSDGRCEACGEVFPCPTGLVIYDAVKRDLEHPTPRPQPIAAPPAPIRPPRPVRWEDLDDRDSRCPQCVHFWVTHGSEPDPDGCGLIVSSMAERIAMAECYANYRVSPTVAGPQTYRDLRHCGCLERPERGSVWDERLAREATRLRAYDGKTDSEGGKGR